MEDARRLGLLLALATTLFVAAYQAPTSIFFDFGPNDSRYVEGFREDFEADGTSLIHWAGNEARLKLPLLVLRGPVSLQYRFKRHVSAPAEIRVFAADSLVDRFTVSEQDFTVRKAQLNAETLPRKPFEIEFFSASSDPRLLGIALDWLEMSPREGLAWVIPSRGGWLSLLGLVFLFYVFPRAIGFESRSSFAFALAAASTLATWAAAQKFAPLHAALQLGFRPYALAVLAVLFHHVRKRVPASFFSRPEARWAILAAGFCTLARLLTLFHPEFYHPDVRVHAKFVSLIWTEGVSGFLSNYVDNQYRLLLGLEPIGGRWVAFPYPPLFYLVVYPLSRLQLPVDDWIKILPTALLGAEALLVYALCGRLGASARAGAAAALIHGTAAFVSFRLTTAFYASVFGHFLDTLVAAYVVFFFDRMERPLVGAGLAALVTLSLLAYTGSAIVLGFWVPLFAGVAAIRKANRPCALRVLFWSAGGALIAVASFYLQYVPELAPAFAQSGAGPGLQLTPVAAILATFRRLFEILGPFYALAFFLAFGFARKRFTNPLARPLAWSVVLAFVCLNVLNHGLGDVSLFRSTKDDLLMLPLFAAVFGTSYALSRERGTLGSIAGRALLAGWVVWGALAAIRDVGERFNRPDYSPGVAKTRLETEIQSTTP